MPTESNKIIDMVFELMRDKEISQTELAQRLHWTKSKLSKVLNGFQKLTTDDLYDLSAALGIANPAILMKADINAVEDKFYNRGLIIDALRDLREAEDFESQRDIVENKIVGILEAYLSLASDGRNARSRSNHLSYNSASRAAFERRGEKPSINWGVMVRDINPLVDRTNHITVGLFLNQDRTSVCLAIVKKSFSDIDSETVKALCTIVEERDSSWIVGGIAHDYPLIRRERVICMKAFSISELSDELTFKSELLKAYDLYSELVSAYMDRVMQGFLESQRKVEAENRDSAKKAAIRTRNNADAMKQANYTCEINADHMTFENPRTGKPFMKAFRLIPLSNRDKIKGDLDCTANVCCLCPNCFEHVQNGTDSDRQEMLTKLYFSHKEALEKSGISVTLMQVFKFNGME